MQKILIPAVNSLGLIGFNTVCFPQDEKDGLMVSLKESSALVEEAKEREAQLQGRIRSLEKQIQSLTDREQEVRAHAFLMHNMSKSK